MSQEVYTVEQVAERLRLHPKTVLRFIRDGRLRAAKVGKSYRILRGDLETLSGAAPAAAPGARVTSIVDIPDVDPELARRLAILLSGARMGGAAHAEPMNLDIAHDPARRHLKVVIVGSPADTAGMLQLLQVWLDR